MACSISRVGPFATSVSDLVKRLVPAFVCRLNGLLSTVEFESSFCVVDTIPWLEVWFSNVPPDL